MTLTFGPEQPGTNAAPSTAPAGLDPLTPLRIALLAMQTVSANSSANVNATRSKAERRLAEARAEAWGAAADLMRHAVAQAQAIQDSAR